MVSETVLRIVGSPVRVERLKTKPGRRRTLRVSGPLGRVVVKIYATARAGTVAARVSALAQGPAEPVVPRILGVAPNGRFLIATDVPGSPLGAWLLVGGRDAARRAGLALGQWHRAWASAPPAVLRPHSVEREMAILEKRLASLPGELAARARRATPAAVRWEPVTVVHRDLYEEQILIGDRVGLIDLDDAAIGPPELDLGNLLAHLDLLELTSGHHLALQRDELLRSYVGVGPPIDLELLDDCRRLSLLRLAAIHRSRSELLLDLAAA